jgi:catechol 2,3-dioxygenase-like lactoylglutathione lyase family enzyme
MNSHTVTIALPLSFDEVFARLTAVAAWPAWAPEFCRELRQHGPLWQASTPGGTDWLAIVSDPRTGVVDLFVGPQRDELTLWPFRVVRQPRGTAIVASFFQPPDWSPELFDRYVRALVAGFRGLAATADGAEVSGLRAPAAPFFPSLVTERLGETWDFYAERLGFRTVCESDDYVHLLHPNGAQLGLLRAELDGPPAEWVSATAGRGFWLTLEVSDADAECARLAGAGVEVVEPIEEKPWGRRQFVVRDPNGVLIAIAHRTAASTEVLAALPAAS